MARTYAQLCPVATALDVVGDRWTLVLVRDLLRFGASRFAELQRANPGIAPNLLAARLRELQEQGLVVRRPLPRPARAAVYELTDRGRALEPVVRALGQWGMAFLEEAPLTPEKVASIVARRSVLLHDDLARLDDIAVVALEAEGWRVVVAAGPDRLQLAGDDEPVSAVVATDGRTLFDLLVGRSSFAAARDAGRLRVDGDEGSAELVVGLLQPRRRHRPAGDAEAADRGS